MIKLPLRYQFPFPARLYFLTLFLVLLIVAVYLIYEFHKQLTFSAKQQFVGLASSNLIATDQSLEELKFALNLAKENYQKYSQNGDNETTSYDVLIEDSQKNLDQISSLKEDLTFQNNLITDSQAPDEYQILKSDFDIYYRKLNEVLDSMENNIQLELDVLKIINSSNSDQNITLTTLWQDGTDEELLNFYQILLEDTIIAKGEIEKLGETQQNKYLELNKKYLSLIESSANEIIAILTANTDEIDEPLSEKSKENAFNVAIRAQTELNQIIEEIASEGSQVYSLDSDTIKLESLNTTQEALETKVKSIYQQLYIDSGDTIFDGK